MSDKNSCVEVLEEIKAEVIMRFGLCYPSVQNDMIEKFIKIIDFKIRECNDESGDIDE